VTLPIIINQIPQSEDLTFWRQIEKTLLAIAIQEKRDDIENRDRIANKVLPLAQSYARQKQWSALWRFLCDREIISTKRSAYNGALLALATVQALANCLNIPKILPVKPVKKVLGTHLWTFWTMRSLIDLLAINIVAPPKPVEKPKSTPSKPPRRPKKPKKAIKPKPFVFRHHLLRFALMQYLGDFLGWAKVLEKRQGREISISIERRLARRSSNGYPCFAILKSVRIGENVKKMLLGWCGKPHTKKRRHSSEAILAISRSRRLVSDDVLSQALSDDWMATGAIALRLSELTGKEITFTQASTLLIRRADAGEIYRYKNSEYHLSLYSRNPDAIEIEREWLTLAEAYALAKERGCQCGINTFRKNWQFKYSKFNIEFRKAVPISENPLLRWRSA